MNSVVSTTPRTNSNARSQRRHCIQLFAPGAVEPSGFPVNPLGKFAQQIRSHLANFTHGTEITSLCDEEVLVNKASWAGLLVQ
jgi:hypothetical protein